LLGVFAFAPINAVHPDVWIFAFPKYATL